MRSCTTKGCGRRERTLGWCNAHYEHWRLHDGRWPQSVDELHPFWRHVRQEGECWIWHGSIAATGYGKYGTVGLPAHRVAYELMVAEIPDGLHLDHLCRVRRCVNPAHLDPVTPKVNAVRRDAALGVGSAKTQCPSGHAYTPENTAHRNGRRHCRACDRDRMRRRRTALSKGSKVA